MSFGSTEILVLPSLRHVSAQDAQRARNSPLGLALGKHAWTLEELERHLAHALGLARNQQILGAQEFRDQVHLWASIQDPPNPPRNVWQTVQPLVRTAPPKQRSQHPEFNPQARDWEASLRDYLHTQHKCSLEDVLWEITPQHFFENTDPTLAQPVRVLTPWPLDPLHLHWLNTWATAHARRTTPQSVTVEIPAIPGSPWFEHTEQWLGQLEATGTEYNLQVFPTDPTEETSLTGNNTQRKSPQQHIAPNPMEEARACMQQVTHWLDQGIDPESILIAAPQPQRWAPLLTLHATNANLRLRTHGSEPLSLRGLGHWLKLAIRSSLGGIQRVELQQLWAAPYLRSAREDHGITPEDLHNFLESCALTSDPTPEGHLWKQLADQLPSGTHNGAQKYPVGLQKFVHLWFEQLHHHLPSTTSPVKQRAAHLSQWIDFWGIPSALGARGVPTTEPSPGTTQLRVQHLQGMGQDVQTLQQCKQWLHSLGETTDPMEQKAWIQLCIATLQTHTVVHQDIRGGALRLAPLEQVWGLAPRCLWVLGLNEAPTPMDPPTGPVSSAHISSALYLALHDTQSQTVVSYAQQDEQGRPALASPWLANLTTDPFVSPTKNVQRGPADVAVAAGAHLSATTPEFPTTSQAHTPPRVLPCTAIEDMARCPFRFHAKHILRIREPDRFDADGSPRSFGTFAHGEFERAMGALIQWGAPYRAIHASEARERVTALFAKPNPTPMDTRGLPQARAHQQAAYIHQCIVTLVQRMYQHDDGYRPWKVEVPFGPDPTGPISTGNPSEQPPWPPLTIASSPPVQLRGRIDLVEIRPIETTPTHPEGHNKAAPVQAVELRVVDLKASRASSLQSRMLPAKLTETELQLLLYAAAAAQAAQQTGTQQQPFEVSSVDLRYLSLRDSLPLPSLLESSPRSVAWKRHATNPEDWLPRPSAALSPTLQSKLQPLVQQAIQGPWNPEPVADACDMCGLQSLCRIDEQGASNRQGSP